MKPYLFLLCCWLVASCQSQPGLPPLPSNPDENSLLWEISGNDIKEPSYLFGTFHLMCPSDIKFSNNLKEALNRSKEVYFEMDLDDAANTLGAIFVMNMKNNKSLKDLYTADEYNRVSRFFTDSLGTPLFAVQRMKPMLLEAMLFPKLMPCKNLSGVEQELLKIVKTQKKEVKGFETMAFQASVFDTIPYEAQAKELLKTIDSLQQFKPYLDSMLLIYQSQKMDGMEKLMNDESFGMKEHNDIMLTKRNQNWVAQMKSILPKTNIFIAVGAGHLAGKNGLIELLRKEGYTVKPLKNKD